MKARLTQQWNGLISLTRYEPIIETVAGTDHKDLYLVPGEPLGFRHMCPLGTRALLGADHLELAGLGDSLAVEAFLIPAQNMTRELRQAIKAAQRLNLNGKEEKPNGIHHSDEREGG